MLRSNSDSTTTLSSPTPVSPFSNESAPSEPTSDEQPNLGAFTTVFREWNHLQPSRRQVVIRQQQSSTSNTSHPSSITPSDHFHSELDSDIEIRPDGSTVWAQKPIAHYLKLRDTDTDNEQDDQPDGQPSDDSDDDIEDLFDSSDTEGDRQSRTIYIADGSDDFEIQSSKGTEGVDVDLVHDDQADYVMPTLGFQEALSFLADERQRLTARAPGSTYNGRLMSLAAASEPRRKRRRRRGKSSRSQSIGPSPDADQDADESSSSYDQYYSTASNNISGSGGELPFRSTPATPSRPRTGRLRHAKSTPQLRLHGGEVPSTNRLFISGQDSLRVKQMKGLMKKLYQVFPEDAQHLKLVNLGKLDASETTFTTNYFSSRKDVTEGSLGSFVDTRGPRCRPDNERIIHVFVDHSNILIGLLNYLKRNPHKHPQFGQTQKPLRHISHSALTLLLERGRSADKRCVVASSPLYQPMNSAEMLGYEVRVFARVPDMGDGMDRAMRPGMGSGNSRSHNGTSVVNIPAPNDAADGLGGGFVVRRWPGSINNGNPISKRKGHSRKVSGSTSTESEHGGSGSGGASYPRAFLRSLGPNGTTSLGDLSTSSTGGTSTIMSLSQGNTPPARIRYREQGVDELLQLKLHQAIAKVDSTPPPGSTIVLATGDGNVGQFNEDGFLGSVRTALKRGWNVELYAWEGGLSKAWRREFGEASEWSRERFRIIGLEQFGSDLVEVYDDEDK